MYASLLGLLCQHNVLRTHASIVLFVLPVTFFFVSRVEELVRACSHAIHAIL
jgi:hypothetical protein